MNLRDLNLQTGDILCWEGRGLVSRGIQLGQLIRHPWNLARISHVGMVWRPNPRYWPWGTGWKDHAEIEDTPAFRPLLTFESTTLNTTADVVTGQVTSGVSLVSLPDKLRHHEGRLYVKQLHGLPDDFERKAAEWAELHHGRGYEAKPWQLMASALGFSRGLWGEDTSTLFCSELVVELLEHCGVLAEQQQDSDAMCPAEVCQIGTRFPTLGGVSVGAMQEVTL